MKVRELKEILSRFSDEFVVEMGNWPISSSFQVEYKYDDEGKNYITVVHFNEDKSW